jgi:addiction module HigA family antidote
MTSGVFALFGKAQMRQKLKWLIITKEIVTMKNIINCMHPIHPGEILREEFLLPLVIYSHALSMVLQVPAPKINEIVRERRAVIVDSALQLYKYFGTSADFG